MSDETNTGDIAVNDDAGTVASLTLEHAVRVVHEQFGFAPVAIRGRATWHLPGGYVEVVQYPSGWIELGAVANDRRPQRSWWLSNPPPYVHALAAEAGLQCKVVEASAAAHEARAWLAEVP